MPVRKTAADKKNQAEPPVQSSQEQQHKEDNVGPASVATDKLSGHLVRHDDESAQLLFCAQNAPQEAEQRQATIILQPGSCSMLLGLSTDPIPHSLPHIIAYSGSGVEGEQDDSLVLKYPAGITVSGSLVGIIFELSLFPSLLAPSRLSSSARPGEPERRRSGKHPPVSG